MVGSVAAVAAAAWGIGWRRRWLDRRRWLRWFDRRPRWRCGGGGRRRRRRWHHRRYGGAAPQNPTVTINQATGQADPTNAGPIQFVVVFSTPVTGFTASDILLSSSTVGGTLVAGVSGAGANYIVAVTGMSGTGTVVASIPAGAVADSMYPTVTNLASTTSDNTVSFSDMPPTVTINQAGGQIDPTTVDPILFAVTFSRPVTGFTAGDVSLSDSNVDGNLVASVSGSGASYMVSVTGIAFSGYVVASIVAGAATDAFGNDSLASTSTDNTVSFTASF